MVDTNDNCKGGTILFLLKNERTETAKKKFLDEVIESCGKRMLKKDRKSGKVGKKQMSGYNCYLKRRGKEIGFQEALEEKGWTKLSSKEKEEYNKNASEGCE